MADDFDRPTEMLSEIRDMPLDELPQGIKGTLTIIHGPLRGQQINLKAGMNTLGRRKSCSIHLPGLPVSGRHAAIYFSELMEWRIRDLESTNGTLLNGSKVKEFALRSGDKISIGDHLLRFSE